MSDVERYMCLPSNLDILEHVVIVTVTSNNCDSHCNRRQCDQVVFFSKLENLENQKISWTRKAGPTFTNAQRDLMMEHMLRHACSDCRLSVSKLTKDIAKVQVISGSWQSWTGCWIGLKLENVIFGFGKDFGGKEKDIEEVNPNQRKKKKNRCKTYLSRLQTQGLDHWLYVIHYHPLSISPYEKHWWINSTRRSCISFQGAGGYQILKILIPGSAWLVSRICYFGWC